VLRPEPAALIPTGLHCRGVCGIATSNSFSVLASRSPDWRGAVKLKQRHGRDSLVFPLRVMTKSAGFTGGCQLGIIMKNIFPKIRLYLLDIPATLVLAPMGFILEFIVTLPFMLACELDGLFQRKT
jgi:hypothetical protein